MNPKCSGLLTGAICLLATALTTLAADYKPVVGIQTWTLRNMDFDGVVEFAKKNGVTELQMIGNHMDPHAPWEENRKKKAVLDEAGLRCYTFGVAGTFMEQARNRELFEFAKNMGIKLIVVEPRDYRILDLLEELVKEYDIKIAIHNHGLKSLYGNPTVVKQLIDHRDPRIGVCMDVGWIASARFDAAEVFRDYNGRVFDIHLKDKKVNNTDNGDVATDTMVGEGDANYAGLFEELRKSEWEGVLAIETDGAGFAGNPQPFVAGALEFVKKHHQ